MVGVVGVVGVVGMLGGKVKDGPRIRAPCYQEIGLDLGREKLETGKLDCWKTVGPGITKIAFACGDYLL
ncbi:GM21229 [Drosophila sechellia]|uniref:GM21229 n=1 Tax=Drosophila sechellia TaxID=7238 RepID=B4HMT1_DROSE|nr:GM21229 [Drosophila sechellia]